MTKEENDKIQNDILLAEHRAIFARTCFACGVNHGSTLKKNGKVILSENKVNGETVLLCQACAFREIQKHLEAPVHGVYHRNTQAETLKKFGLVQEKLL